MHRTLESAVLVFALGLSTVASAEKSSKDSSTQPRVPHPEPRVIVNVLSVRGPHDPAQVQRAARFGWGRIVRCYKTTGARERANVTMQLLVSGDGKVIRAIGAGREPRSRELSECLGQSLRDLTMPKASASSTAAIEIRLAPGDPPA